MHAFKKIKEHIKELKFVKGFQQGMEIITGVDLSKKSLLKIVAKNKNILK